MPHVNQHEINTLLMVTHKNTLEYGNLFLILGKLCAPSWRLRQLWITREYATSDLEGSNDGQL